MVNYTQNLGIEATVYGQPHTDLGIEATVHGHYTLDLGTVTSVHGQLHTEPGHRGYCSWSTTY